MSRPDLGLRFHGDVVAGPGQLDFAVNVVPGGPPGWLLEALRDGLSRAAAYPDERPATAAVATRHGRPPEEVVLLNGGAEAFWLLAQVLRPRLAVVVAPSFTEPEAALQATGQRVRRVWRDPDHFHLDPAAVPAEADLVVTGNPNNPTGTLDPAAVLAGLARPGRVLVVDEAFMEFTAAEAETLAGRRDLPGLVVVRSLTKLWGLAGIRAGYLFAPPQTASLLRAARQPWGVNGLACAALAAWADQGAEHAAHRIQRLAATREQLAAALAALPGVRIWPSAANFLLLQVADGPAVLAGLAARGIAVRPCHSFPGLTANHLRVAVSDPDDNRRLVDALGEALISSDKSG
ncbi:MAG TPA: Rv2231c family pyridoxal phosphate-dependent protein CobC [Actinomycetes bacterium]|jgi:histidinol-phosphate/aromatic aminotransferase/cobyric acid decarboxylase-like protein|nr:Rv2231c family pyridoxal phosphate-dependent protein CobC [Actinomycetes bacterium]